MYDGPGGQQAISGSMLSAIRRREWFVRAGVFWEGCASSIYPQAGVVFRLRSYLERMNNQGVSIFRGGDHAQVWIDAR